VNDGIWMARSAEFMQTGLMETLRWMRVIGDTIFAIGFLALAWFVLGLKACWSQRDEQEAVMAIDYHEYETERTHLTEN